MLSHFRKANILKWISRSADRQIDGYDKRNAKSSRNRNTIAYVKLGSGGVLIPTALTNGKDRSTYEPQRNYPILPWITTHHSRLDAPPSPFYTFMLTMEKHRLSLYITPRHHSTFAHSVLSLPLPLSLRLSHFPSSQGIDAKLKRIPAA